MKKQVLSFNEFINEAYNVIYEKVGEKAANNFVEAVSKLEKAGISDQAKNMMGIISGIAKTTATKDNKDPEGALGTELLDFLDGITERGVTITKLETKINTLPYDNIVGGSVLLEGDNRVKLMDFVYDLNLGNSASKGSAGAYVKRGKSYWNKISQTKRFVGPAAMSEYIGRKRLKWFAQGVNWLASFIPFKKETASQRSKTSKDTLYLTDSGLLGNEVITNISNGVITTKQSEILSKDMFWGGKSRVGKDRRGFSNVKGDKNVVTGYKIELPLDASLTNDQKLPTKNKKSKVEKVPKAYFTLVLYAVGDVTKSDREIPFSELVKTEKSRTIGENSVEYTVDVYNNDDSGKPVLFDVDKAVLKPEGKENIDNAIEQFYSIDSIEILGFASQEGDVTNNKNLCINRAKAVADYIKTVKEWNIPSSAITASTSSNIQPATPKATEPERKKWRKVQLKIKGTISTPTDPKTENYIEYVPTMSKFNPDKADIQQICLCFEVGSKDTSIEGK